MTETGSIGLEAAYRTCRRMQRRHDPTYYYATRRLPADVQPAVHALYGFVRGADQIVDGPRRPATIEGRRAALDRWEGALREGLDRGHSGHPVIAALVDASARHELPLSDEMGIYMRSMRVDCGPVRIHTRDELDRYMRGSAGSVGRVMAPLLGAAPDLHGAFVRLGIAFQLTNFIRDVREDYSLDRVYLPDAEFERFGIEERDLGGIRACSGLRGLLREEVARARSLFAEAAPAVDRALPGVQPGMRMARAVYLRLLDRVERIGFDVLGRRVTLTPWEFGPTVVRSLVTLEVTIRATKRGAERSSLEGERVEVLICGASFAGLSVARELAAVDADVLVLDRYEIGERATSACAAPTPWLHAMRVESAIRAELPFMTFTTPHRSVRYRLPWSWSSFDYRELCEALWEQCGESRFETATVTGRAEPGDDVECEGDEIAVRTDRGTVRAPLVVDALGWRRVLSDPHYQPPEAPLSRGLEVHPGVAGSDDSLDVWIERGLVRRGYGWRVPAGTEARVGVGSYDPHQHVKQPTVALSKRLAVDAVRYQGNWFPHRLRPSAEAEVFFVGDSAGHCFPLSGEGIRTAFYFGIACGRELRAALAGERSRREALERYAAFSARHARAFRFALRLQRLIPALPPRALSVLLRGLSRSQSLIDRCFGWYLEQAHPAFAAQPPSGDGNVQPPDGPSTVKSAVGADSVTTT